MADVGLRQRLDRLERRLEHALSRIQQLEGQQQAAADLARKLDTSTNVTGERPVQRQAINQNYRLLGERLE